MSFRLAGQNIRANSVSPGNTYFDGGVWNQIETGNPGLYADSLALNPTGRMATPEEIANAVLFLATKAPKNMTGQFIAVDGGFTLPGNFPNRELFLQEGLRKRQKR